MRVIGSIRRRKILILRNVSCQFPLLPARSRTRRQTGPIAGTFRLRAINGVWVETAPAQADQIKPEAARLLGWQLKK